MTKWKLICFLPDSLDNDIDINYEDEDGTENEIYYQTFGVADETYPVEDRRPALHGDALEDGEHGQDNVVEAGDPLVGPLPVLQAD